MSERKGVPVTEIHKWIRQGGLSLVAEKLRADYKMNKTQVKRTIATLIPQLDNMAPREKYMNKPLSSSRKFAIESRKSSAPKPITFRAVAPSISGKTVRPHK